MFSESILRPSTTTEARSTISRLLRAYMPVRIAATTKTTLMADSQARDWTRLIRVRIVPRTVAQEARDSWSECMGVGQRANTKRAGSLLKVIGWSPLPGRAGGGIEKHAKRVGKRTDL